MNVIQRARLMTICCLAAMIVLLCTTGARAAAVTLSLPKLEVKAGQEVEVPITVKGAKGLSALQMRLTYDPAVLEVVRTDDDPDAGITMGKILPENASFKVYTSTIPAYGSEAVAVTPGRLPIVFAGGTNKQKKEYYAVEDDGTLLSIRFRVTGNAGQKTTLKLEEIKAFASNDMDMLVKTTPGEVTITGAPLPWLWIAVALVVGLLLLIVLLSRRRRPASTP